MYLNEKGKYLKINHFRNYLFDLDESEKYSDNAHLNLSKWIEFQEVISSKYSATYSLLLSSVMIFLYFSLISTRYLDALSIDIAKAIRTIITGSFESYSNTSMKFYSNFYSLHKFYVIVANVCLWTNF